MFKSQKSKWIALAIILLLALNFIAVYVLNQSIDNRKLIPHANSGMKDSLQQQEMFSDIFSSAVFTLDIFGVLILLYFLIKMLFRKMKNSSAKS